MLRPSADSTRLPILFAAIAMLWAALSTLAVSAQVTSVGADDTTRKISTQSSEETRTPQERENWQQLVETAPLPKKGCFASDYPNPEWKEVPCAKAPLIPMPPSRGLRPLVVGATNDIAAEAPSDSISSTTGSFTISGVSSETGKIGNVGSPVDDAYTLQINPNFFTGVSECTGHAGCTAWEQFVYWDDGVNGQIRGGYPQRSPAPGALPGGRVVVQLGAPGSLPV